MSILRTCENCLSYDSDKDCYWCTRNLEEPYSNFIPSEEAIRKDEKAKIIALLKSDLDSLDLSEYDNMFMDENYAVADYIKKIISILEGEK